MILGGGRYIPGTDTSTHASGPMTDPLTGGGRYVPSYGDSAPAATANDSDPLKGRNRQACAVGALETILHGIRWPSGQALD